MNWKALIKKMVSTSVPAIDTTYTKPARRSVTGIPTAIQVGATAIKPGLKVREEKENKICLVFDTSGSMWGHVPTVMAEAQTLLGMVGKSKFPIMVVFFAGDSEWYKINLSQDSYQRIGGISDADKPMAADAKKGWKTVLSLGGSGGTVFSDGLASDLGVLAGAGYNVMIFSDSDMLAASNWANLFILWKAHKQKVFYVANNEATWRTACKQAGQFPDNWSHL